MSYFDQEYKLRGGRCFYCQRLVPVSLMTRDHILPKIHGGHGDWSNLVLACAPCNEAKSGLHVGSIRFGKWLRRVMRGEVYRFVRREKRKHNST